MTLNELKESLGYGNSIERALYIHPFVVEGGWTDAVRLAFSWMPFRRPIAPEAQADIKQLKDFPDWQRTIATSETAVRFGTLLRQETIRKTLENAGKMKE